MHLSDSKSDVFGRVGTAWGSSIWDHHPKAAWSVSDRWSSSTNPLLVASADRKGRRHFHKVASIWVVDDLTGHVDAPTQIGLRRRRHRCNRHRGLG